MNKEKREQEDVLRVCKKSQKRDLMNINCRRYGPPSRTTLSNDIIYNILLAWYGSKTAPPTPILLSKSYLSFYHSSIV